MSMKEISLPQPASDEKDISGLALIIDIPTQHFLRLLRELFVYKLLQVASQFS